MIREILVAHLKEENTIEALCIQLMFQLGVRIGGGIALKFSDMEYEKIAIQRMKEKVLVFDGEYIFERDGGRLTASQLSTAGMPLDRYGIFSVSR